MTVLGVREQVTGLVSSICHGPRTRAPAELSGQPRRSEVGSVDLPAQFRLIATLLAVSFLIGACSGSTGSSTTSAAAGSTAPADEGSGSTTAEGPTEEEIDLVLWVARDYFAPADNFDAFHAQYPNINVSVDIRDDAEVLPQLVRMREAGERLPDVVQLDGAFRGQMAEAGLIMDITDLVARWEEEDPEGFNLLYDIVWEDALWDGNIMGMADAADVDMLFYRPDWYSEAGFEGAPTTWDEVLEVSHAINATRPEGDVPFAMDGARGAGANTLLSQMLAYGIEFEGVVPQLDSEAGHSLIGWYQTMSREGLFAPETLAWTLDDTRTAFYSERAGMWISAIDEAQLLVDIGEQGEAWDVAFMPLGEGGQNTAIARNYHITSDAPHPYEASLIFRELTRTEQVMARATTSGGVPRQAAVLESEEFAAYLPAFTEELREAFINAGPFPTGTNFFEVQEALELFRQEIIENTDESPEELAARWQAELDGL